MSSGLKAFSARAESVSRATRATGFGFSYNIGVTVFGGMGPAIMTWMGSFALIGDLAPGYYLTVIAALSLCALITIRKTAADTSPRNLLNHAPHPGRASSPGRNLGAPAAESHILFWPGLCKHSGQIPVRSEQMNIYVSSARFQPLHSPPGFVPARLMPRS